MTEAERRAYGLIAQAIAQHGFAKATANEKHYIGQFPGAPRPIYYHDCDSTFEAVAHDLWRLGILRPLDQTGNWADCFAFSCQVSESNIIAERNWPTGPTLFQLLLTFINLFGDYGTEYWGFSTKPNIPFGIDSRIIPALEALATLGYLLKTDAGYVWTELIVPVMRESYNYKDWPDPVTDEQA